MLNKNDYCELIIEGMTTEGNGVGKNDGIAVFVPFTAIGDRVKVKIVQVKKTYAYGIIEEILENSSDRIDSDCEVFRKCGGCAFRHISYQAELEIKQNFVADAFKRIGKIDFPLQKIIGAENTDYYRNKAQYPVSDLNGQVVCGFYSRRSHRVVPFTKCKLQPVIFEEITNLLVSLFNQHRISAYNEQTHRGIIRHIYLREGYHSGEIMLCIVATKNCKKQLEELIPTITESFPQIKSIVLNVNPQNTNVILGKQNFLVFDKETIIDTMCGNKITLSPHSFYQINTPQAERLYLEASKLADLTGKELLIDLYCGAGTIGLSMAKNCRELIGVEIVPEAVENAKNNALLNNITNAKFLCGDASQMAEKLCLKGTRPDVVIVDPPRKGCDVDILEAIVKMSPQKLIMISCNPATAARDCSLLTTLGYEVGHIQPVDLFPRTGHVECLVLLSKKNTQ